MTSVTEDLLRRAQRLIETQKANICCDRSRPRLYIEVVVHSAMNTARAVVEGTHANLVSLQHNGRELHDIDNGQHSGHDEELDAALMNVSLAELADFAEQLQPSQADYIKHGIDMNLGICEKGYALQRVGYYISQLVVNKQREDSLISACESMTAAAADARMGGLDFPVMSSGGSGNQGIVAILVPYLVGQHYDVEEMVILRSITLSHLINSYVKCFTGELSPLCGCAIAAGVGAAAGIVYQRAGKDMEKITLAINNLISDLGGMLCDGAKEGCALKVASATDSAIRSAHMALNNHGITKLEGFVGETAEDTIRNLGKIGDIGMSQANETMLGIMIQKSAKT